MYWNKGKLYKKARGKRQCIMCQMEQKNVDFMNVKNVEIVFSSNDGKDSVSGM